MRAISTTTCIALGLACIICSVVLAAHFFGLMPDSAAALTQERVHISQVIASQCSAAATRNDPETIRTALGSLLATQHDVISAGVRSPDGKLVVKAGPHEQAWHAQGVAKSPLPGKGMEIEAPILQNGHPWASVEIYFAPIPVPGFFSRPLVRLVLFVAASGFLGSMLFLRKVLKHLDPSSVIPDRVRAMLDSLAESVVIADNREQIVMANEAFCRLGNTSLANVQGRKLSDIEWIRDSSIGAGAGEGSGGGGVTGENLPWKQSLATGIAVRRVSFRVDDSQGRQRALVASAVPILGTGGARRGVLATFDDVTTVEAANAQLRSAMDELGRSRDEIARKNRELEILASRDHLTGCLNRRAFMRAFEEAWTAARAQKNPLACIMLDIDHFKNINDRYGHSVGDQVLRQMGQLLQSTCRSNDQICRYGGEEFCMFLPGATFEEAHFAAERIRSTLLETRWPVSSVTASLGVTGIEAGATELHAILDQADRALYAAKRTGRNRVVPWGDPALEGALDHSPEDRRISTPSAQIRELTCGLFEALHDRDKGTAEHSQRVAEIALRIGDGLCDDEQLELLRIAALLHDIGKLAVPDDILHKRGPLDESQWNIIRQHEGIGAALVDRAVHHAGLTEIIKYHHAWFGGTPHEPKLPKGDDIPLLCRIVLVADAYDALVSDRPYRQATTPELAMAELQRCAGTQFDPSIVNRLEEILESDPQGLSDCLSQLSVGDASQAIEKLAGEIDSISALTAEVQPHAMPESSQTPA